VVDFDYQAVDWRFLVNVPSIYGVAEGNVPKGKGEACSVYAVLCAILLGVFFNETIINFIN
jgi:hypothetical protein